MMTIPLPEPIAGSPFLPFGDQTFIFDNDVLELADRRSLLRENDLDARAVLGRERNMAGQLLQGHRLHSHVGDAEAVGAA